MAKKKERKYSVIQRLLVLAVSVYLLYSLGDLQYQLIAQKKEYAALEEQKEVMSQQIAELQNLLSDGTEAEIIEKAARERLGFVYADEKIYEDISGN